MRNRVSVNAVAGSANFTRAGLMNAGVSRNRSDDFLAPAYLAKILNATEAFVCDLADSRDAGLNATQAATLLGLSTRKFQRAAVKRPELKPDLRCGARLVRWSRNKLERIAGARDGFGSIESGSPPGTWLDARGWHCDGE